MNNEPRKVRPELFRVAGTVLAALIVMLVFLLDLGTSWLLLAVMVYGLTTALFGLAVLRNWRGIGQTYRAQGTIGFTGWAQLAVGTVMMAAAVIALVTGTGG